MPFAALYIGMTQIPPIKRTMEKLVFRVKLLTHGTEFGKDFKVGNLKHKALDGSVISSQVRGWCEDNWLPRWRTRRVGRGCLAVYDGTGSF